MRFKNIKVYHLFWFLTAIVLLIGICKPNETLDINIHDTYFVIAHLHVAIAVSLFFFLNGLGYWLVQKVLKRKPEKYLTLIHAGIVIGSFAIYQMIIFYNTWFPANPDFPLFDDYQLMNIFLVSSTILNIFVALPVYITNLLITIFKLRNT